MGQHCVGTMRGISRVWVSRYHRKQTRLIPLIPMSGCAGPASPIQFGFACSAVGRELQWYGHVSRSSGLAKTILQGTVKGGRRQSRQWKRWEDNIREWTVLEFGRSQRAVKNREKWRKLVATSSVVPQRPSRLRDLDDEMMMMTRDSLQQVITGPDIRDPG